jgi:hypothetical protein
MAKARKNVQISQDSWDKYHALKRRYDTPINQIIENIVENSASYDDLDRLFGYKKPRRVR